MSLPTEKVNMDSVISKKVQLVSKMPKIAPLVEKTEKFHTFFKSLCSN